jgi:hypothetical protein
MKSSAVTKSYSIQISRTHSIQIKRKYSRQIKRTTWNSATQSRMRHLRSAQALCLKIHSTVGHIALSKDIEAPCTCTARQQMHFTQPCCQMQHNHSSRSGAAVSLQSQPVGHRPAGDDCIQVKRRSTTANAPLTVRPQTILQKRGGSLSI